MIYPLIMLIRRLYPLIRDPFTTIPTPTHLTRLPVPPPFLSPPPTRPLPHPPYPYPTLTPLLSPLSLSPPSLPYTVYMITIPITYIGLRLDVCAFVQQHAEDVWFTTTGCQVQGRGSILQHRHTWRGGRGREEGGGEGG